MQLALHTLVALAVWTPSALAGDVWTVDKNDPSADFQSLQVAANAVPDGDVLLVQSGGYGPFVVQGKGLTIVAEVGADVRVNGAIEVRNVPAASSVFLRNLRTGNPQAHGVSVRQCQGLVHVEGCELVGRNVDDGSFDVYSGAFVAGSDHVLFHECQLTGSFGIGVGFFSIPGSAGHGADVRESNVTFTACELRGSYGASGFPGEGSDGGLGGHGLRVLGSDVQVEGCSLIGGSGGDGDADFEPFGGKTCGDGGDGGDGIHVDSEASVVGAPTLTSSIALRDNVLQPGPGGFGKCAPSGDDGEPLDLDPGAPHGLLEFSGQGRSVALDSPVRGGEIALLKSTLIAGDFLVTLVSAPQTPLPIAGQILPLVSGGPGLSVSLFGVAPTTGSQFIQLPVPVLPLGFGGETIVLQGVVLGQNAVELQLLPASSITVLE